MATNKKLAAYEKKRDFKKTPEPGPVVADSKDLMPGGVSQFFIQRHDATHLHYDFRLLIDGTLKSWAVPKGPSLDPAVKRLAMEVEDHPLSYGDFEGNIPKGEYGGGSVMLWDRGAFTLGGDVDALAQLKRGDLKFSLNGEKLKGDFGLVRTKPKENQKPAWLLIKKKDDHTETGWDIDRFAYSIVSERSQEDIAANAKSKANTTIAGAVQAPMPKKVAPMLATLMAGLPSSKGWAFEIKWDGVRAICRIDAGKLEMISRNDLSYTSRFPELHSLPACVAAKQAILDGEIVMLDEKGRPSFQALQPRLGLKAGGGGKAELYLFDLLYCDGYDLRGASFEDRKNLLKKIVTPQGPIRISEHVTADGDAMLKAAAENGLEGIIAKRLDSVYESGRSNAWMKVKVHLRQEFAILGWIPGKRQIASLILGLREGEAWVWSGNVGTGFDMATLDSLLEKLKKIETLKAALKSTAGIPRTAHWVKPEMVAEIQFAEWTAERKLRAPVFQGLRMDKKALEATPETQVALTNLDKVYFPEDGITKGDVIAYYESIADTLLPYLKDRPLSLRRYPNGIHGPSFFQKNLDKSAPSWLETVEIYSNDSKRTIRYAIANDLPSLLYVVNLGCIDHNPWMSRRQSLDEPDFALIDLDPHEAEFSKVVVAAKYVHEILKAVQLEPLVKTSGGHGIHVVVPLAEGLSYDEVQTFMAALARLTAKQRPDLFTVERALKRRPKGRIYFDHVQIGKGKTIAAPYVIRPYPGAPVGTPLEWKEVNAKLSPANFNIGNARKRLEKKGDLFQAALSKGQKLAAAAKALEKLASS